MALSSHLAVYYFMPVGLIKMHLCKKHGNKLIKAGLFKNHLGEKVGVYVCNFLCSDQIYFALCNDPMVT